MIEIIEERLGKLNSKEVKRYILRNKLGFEVHVLNLGAIISKILTHNRSNKLVNVVLGYDFFEDYINDPSYAGATIGPTAGRIENGKYVLNGIEYVQEINNGTNSNHGGLDALTSKVFDVRKVNYKEYQGIELEYKWEYLLGKFKNNITFYITYLLKVDSEELKIELSAVTDKEAYINLTNHSYFNLAGDLSINGDEQLLKINADRYCEVKENMIPSGKKIEVDNTCFDFRNLKKIKDGISEGDKQFNITRAYDHAFILNNNNKSATLYSEYSGIKMDLITTNNVLVMYSGNYLDDVKTFEGVNKNSRFLGIALEAQNYQNGINIEGFDSKITKPTMPYNEIVILKFTNKND